MKPITTLLYIISIGLFMWVCWNQRQDNRVLRDQIHMLMTNGVPAAITNTP